MMSESAPSRPCRVAIAGFGTVGQSVARILTSGVHSDLALTHVCNRNVASKRVDWVGPDVVWTESFDDLLAADVDVVVELIGGASPAEEWIARALSAGIPVVTANKQVIAQAGPELMRQARSHRTALLFEAAVAGGIPIVRGMLDGVSGDRLTRVRGILNGTCNYILTSMEAEGVSFGDALAEAQRLGFAEADPTADVEGFDAQAKLAILLAVGLEQVVTADDIPLASITAVEAIDFVYAKRLGCVIRQVAQAEVLYDGGVRASVRPALVPGTSALARVAGSQNIVVVEGQYGGETAFSGYGAGGDPTAVAVVSDLVALARGAGGAPADLFPDGQDRAHVTQAFEAPHYLRFTIADRPGIIAALAEVFSRHSVNVDAVLQEPGWSKTELPFVMTLESCGSEAVRTALAEIERFDFHVQPPVWLPVVTEGEDGV